MSTAVVRLGYAGATLYSAVGRKSRSANLSFPATWARGRRAAVQVRAAKDEDKDDVVAGVIKTASGLVDKATELVPESVPRPAAKAGVALGGVMIAFWLLQKVISGVVTLALFAGVGYYFLTKSGKDDTIDVTPTGKTGKTSGDDLDDPLAEARKIMDKYK